MPLAVRYVEPKHLCRRPLPNGVKNELQAVAVLSLAGAMRQISSLAKQAESLMGDLCDTLADYNRRALYLDDRIKQLKRKVKKINPIEEGMIMTIHNNKYNYIIYFMVS
jgi:hypothetical protein